MGNANVNAGGFGVDWNEQGGGATLFGIRVGGGPNGAEVGVNVGVGAQVDGEGAYAGAGAKATVGGNGVGGSAGVQANLGNQEAGAAAGGQRNYDGSTSTYAVDTCASNVRLADVELRKSKEDLAFYTKNRDKAQAAATKAQEELDDANTDFEKAEDEHQEAQTNLGTAGIAKTEALNNYSTSQMENDATKTEIRQAQKSLDGMTKLGKASVEAKIVQLQDKLVGLQKDLTDFAQKVNETDDNLAKAETRWNNAIDILDKKQKALQEKRGELTTKKDLLKSANGSVDDAKEKVKKHQTEKDEKEKLYMEERKKQETYRQARRLKHFVPPLSNGNRTSSVVAVQNKLDTSF